MQEFRKSKAWDIAAKLCRDKGMYFLGQSTCNGPNRMSAFYSRRKISKIEDFAGMKFRLQGAGYAEFVKALGGTAVIIPMPEYYTAMERGTVDGLHVGVPGVIEWGCLEVTNYMLEELLGSNSSAFLVNLNVWGSLPKNL